ncbi:MAG: NAD-binding protein [Propionibacteriaceae bacterium]|jgi:3-hydroxyisobutyrate dehydrogenase|nr:NAD-binding protein [Propionibacteriaceae bacterium]
MNIAFLGLGRMGAILAGHVAASEHTLTVWNRDAAKAEPFLDLGATVALSSAAAVADAEVVFTCFFGPDSVREVVLDAELPWSTGAVWVDITTVGPHFAAECADWAAARGIRYVHAPVLGSLGPARNRDLGVLLGAADAEARSLARSIVSLWADPERIIEYDTAAKAGVGKLVVNYGLAVGVQALVEALTIAEAGGLTLDEGLALTGLAKTPLATIAGMKGATIKNHAWEPTQFSTNLLAKDVDLMFAVAGGLALPALTAAFASLERARRAGHGEHDFSALAGEKL